MAIIRQFFPQRATVCLITFAAALLVEVGALSSSRTTTLQPTDISRRDLLTNTFVSGLAGLFLPQIANGASFDDANSKPIAILGASGRTGALCVTSCLTRGLPVLALTRSGSWVPPPTVAKAEDDIASIMNNKLLQVDACDVKDPQALASKLKGCRGVIYAASASKKGGSAKEIDNDGVVQAGEVCLAEKIPRYVVISSTATTRPNSLGYKFTNVLGGIMEQKRLGEEGIQSSFRAAEDGSKPSTSSSFTIVRAGGLEEPKKNEIQGPGSLEISQGDALSGIVSRADLAEAAVELAVSTIPSLQNTALELYYTASAQPCEKQFKSMMSNGVVPRLHGDTYAELFQGVEPFVDYYVPA